MRDRTCHNCPRADRRSVTLAYLSKIALAPAGANNINLASAKAALSVPNGFNNGALDAPLLVLRDVAQNRGRGEF